MLVKFLCWFGEVCPAHVVIAAFTFALALVALVVEFGPKLTNTQAMGLLCIITCTIVVIVSTVNTIKRKNR